MAPNSTSEKSVSRNQHNSIRNKVSLLSARPSYPHQKLFWYFWHNHYFSLYYCTGGRKCWFELRMMLYLFNLRRIPFSFCLFVCCFPFLVRPCNLLGCSPTKQPATHTGYYGIACKIVYSLQIPRKKLQ